MNNIFMNNIVLFMNNIFMNNILCNFFIMGAILHMYGIY
jgi:hypothetical protein